MKSLRQSGLLRVILSPVRESGSRLNFAAKFPELHHSAITATVPYSWRHYSSWRFISEISRRWPGRFRVFECPGQEGLPETSVWYLNEKSEHSPLGSTAIRVNDLRSIQVAAHDENHDCELFNSSNTDADFWVSNLDVLFSTDLEHLILDVESCLEGWSPAETPPTRFDTIGQRVLAECLALRLHSKNPLKISAYLFDGLAHADYLLEQVPSASRYGESLRQKEILNQLFFVEVVREDSTFKTFGDKAILAVDCSSGSAFVGNVRLDLMSEYALCGRSIAKLAFKLLDLAGVY
jgi:hypothetical protein